RPLAGRLADACAVAGGLAAIHAAGIVHRDVSPQNVLRMADGRLVVSDFGLATDASESTTSIQGGTVAYMAPEGARGGRAGFRADVGSLGVVIHEIVFREKPRWTGGARQKLDLPAIRGSRAARERAALVACRVCLALDPRRRPHGAEEVLAILTEAP